MSAVTGSGKSGLLSEICAQVWPEPGAHIIVSTSTVHLVRQLAQSIGKRLGEKVGRWYADRKTVERVTIVCNASMETLLDHLKRTRRVCALWLVDEAHGSQCATMLEAGRRLEGVPRLGFTATPYRAHGEQRLDLFDSLVFRYGLNRALSEGVVVRPEVVPWQGKECDLDRAALSMIQRHVHYGPGVVNARDIDDAERFAAWLCTQGVRAQAVHCAAGIKRTNAALKALEHEEIDCVVHVSLLTEGVDLPWLRWLCLRREVSSRVRYAQEVGRGLRAYPGKDRLYLLDPVGATSRLSLSYGAMLSLGREEDEGSGEKEERRVRARDGRPPSSFGETHPQVCADPLAVNVDKISFDLSRLRSYLEIKGVVQGRAPMSAQAAQRARDKEAQEEELTRLEFLKEQLAHVPIPVQTGRVLGWAIHHRATLCQADAMTLTACLEGLVRHGWPSS